MARDPKDDERMYRALGFAMSKAQMMEVEMVRVMEAQEHDLSVPLDDRWQEISRWLDMTAGQLRALLGVPEEIAVDLSAAVGRRNRVAHESWMPYALGDDSHASADDWVPWLAGEASMLQQVLNGLVRIREALIKGDDLDPDQLVSVWREEVPTTVEHRPDRDDRWRS